MAEIKWIKLDINVFNNRKIEQLEVLPDGDGIVVIWFKLLCLAGSINDDGMIYFTNEIPYTEEMLATQFHRPLSLIKLALRMFEQFRMISIIDNIIHISNWEKYQNIDGLQKVREQGKARIAKYREKQRELPEATDSSVTSNVTVTHGNATDIDIDRDIEVDVDTVSKRESTGAAAPTPSKHTKTERHQYGQYCWVRLTDEQHACLLSDLGAEELRRCITYIDESAQSNGNKNKWRDWYLVIRKCSKQRWGLDSRGQAAPVKVDTLGVLDRLMEDPNDT